MIGLDTNVLVRYLTQDEPVQAKLATELVESLSRTRPGFVSLVVLVETVWVLESCYDADRKRVIEVLETLLQVESLVVASAEAAWQALRCYRQEGNDFADALIATLARRAGCEKTFSFDRGAADRFDMALLG